ncbi:hypothetical protein V5O48_013905 [Marasmius crinis-equi]|uniref:Ricin B lectin domain-containing protein n=1 Tax=Marasmius crinis-equi TaxID=585013 RepID=A0ABR3EYT3_9AGAR
MPGPASGVYYVKNVKTGYFITKEEIGSGKRVISRKDAEPADLQVSENGGVYQFIERSSGLSIGVNPTVNPPDLIWQRAVYLWTIQQVSPGIWNIGTPVDNSYWIDSKAKAGTDNVTLSQGSADDANNWQLIAAAH